MTTYWKQSLVQTDARFSAIVKDAPNMEEDPFDSATFLYDLYKTSTVKEIEQFKAVLSKVQKDIVECQLKQKISGREVDTKEDSIETLKSSQNTIINVCKDLIEVDSHLKQTEDHLSQLNNFVKEQLEDNLLEKIVKQQE